MTKFSIEMLPAKHGDALWIEYADGDRTRRISIDGGPIQAYEAFEACMARLPDDDKRVELLVISHVDTDHIEGMIRMMARPRGSWPISPADIWFNGYRHIGPRDDLGGREGEMISALIHARVDQSWNKAFHGEAVVVEAGTALPQVTLAGGMTLTLLSPDREKLDRLAVKWKDNLKKFTMTVGDLEEAWRQLAALPRFKLDQESTLGSEDIGEALRELLKGQDGSDANGSSIAFLARCNGKSCLFLADAHIDLINESLAKLVAKEGRQLKVDAVKVSHHGSKNNLDARFFDLVDAKHYLISTNGDQHEHPDKPAMEAIIAGSKRKPVLWFNYRSDHTLPYEEQSKLAGARFTTRYPREGKEGIVIRL
ncbi:ComEC/Rec2 family competence protein [Massilia glaciei]|uniref:MBL fold metallo-hydrolase n=1 Tax=Massilia glaciei TaxID=1524097 RepID=A0A2U2HFX1_9BURK|nr:hypothetical protein [Massilia glaciei]PWF43612.1 hypothetical protein C7C56_020985 [Massilia glaciei]